MNKKSSYIRYLGILFVIVASTVGAFLLINIIQFSPKTPVFEKPEHYKTIILKSNYSEHLITLEMYADQSARMIFDYKGESPDDITIRVEDGVWKAIDDAKRMAVTLNGYWSLGEDTAYTPYKPVSEFIFEKTDIGINALTYDHQRYPYDSLNFIMIPDDERLFYGRL